MNWKFWKSIPKIRIIYTWQDNEGKVHNIKSVDELTPEEQETIRQNAIRSALHRAVDMGLYDDQVRNIEEENQNENGPR